MLGRPCLRSAVPHSRAPASTSAVPHRVRAPPPPPSRSRPRPRLIRQKIAMYVFGLLQGARFRFCALSSDLTVMVKL
ncbi:hypothetical protein EJB05_32287, partial [Eragrostis curvula]